MLGELLAGYDPYHDCGDYVYDEKTAKRYCDFIELGLTHTKGSLAGKPIELMHWQRVFISTLFGWIDPETGFRRYRDCFLFLPRKNGAPARRSS